ncbi:MAG: hypothetical protein LBQ62_03575, partial [Candidatus Accumulibacter sp.]|nr:hypothetical protein [Accumulibacter sp.]
HDTFAKLYDRLKKWKVRVYFSDDWSVYSRLIPPELLVQAKVETHRIESNNFPQRHWFARFRRKTCCVSRSLEMIDLATMLYAKHHANGNIII